MSNQTPKQKVLVVDDNPVNISLLAEALKHDYQIKIATDGERALQIACSDDKPDLVLLDIMMPGLDGYAVCRALKQDDATRNIPVIFITAKNQVDDELRGLELGAVDYITKPFHLPIIKARVRTHMDLKHKSDLLESLVSLDALTEIPNRRHFDEAFQAQWRVCQRAGLPLSLLIADIDYFKLYNDTYGHSEGDVCLKRVAAAFKRSLLRPSDVAARYGGEEFVALLPGSDPCSAMVVAQRMLDAVRGLGLAHSKSQAAPYVTLSIGGACLVPSVHTSALGLLNLADAALYRAKAEGRDRIVFETVACPV